MPNLAEIVHRRRERRADLRRRAESRVRAAGLGLGYIFSIALAILIFASVFAYADLTRDLPSIEQLPILLNQTNGLLLQPTRVYDRTGEHVIFTFAPTDSQRVYLPLGSLPESLVDATIAASDPRFESHAGYCIPPSRKNWPTIFCSSLKFPLFDAPCANASSPRRSPRTSGVTR
jgi:membrane peptidoglycan carboxypeptidase